MPVSLLKRRLKTLVVSALSTAIGYGIITEFFFSDTPQKAVESVINTATKTVVDQVKAQAPSVGDVERLIPDIGRIAGGVSGYDRKEFGSWIDVDGDCQNTRHEVLIMQSIVSPSLSNSGCSVTAGQWDDPYSGKRISDPKKLDIDHVVPLKWAYESGAAQWSADKKRAFANDFSNLIAVSSSLNRQKGADSPFDWMPPNPAYRCDYVIRFYKIARQYDLLAPQTAIRLREMRTKECR
jgi:hypothetical protein